MIVNKIDVTTNYRRFIEAFKYEGNRRDVPVDDASLERVYGEVATMCFNRYIGEDFGNLIEHIATSINIRDRDSDEQYGQDYMVVYENGDTIEDLYNIIKFNGNGMFRGDGYEDNINIDINFHATGKVELVFNTDTPLFNSPVFNSVDTFKPDKVIELENEFILFRNIFKTYLLNRYSHNSNELHPNDFYALFAGLVELIIMYEDKLEIEQEDILDQLDTLFRDIIEMLDPHDTELFSNFYKENIDYINTLSRSIYYKCKDKYDFISWGVLGDKVFIGLALKI